jgi:hypothetical protein
MLRRDSDARPRRRFGSDAAAPDPFPREAPVPPGATTDVLGGWTAPVSYLVLEPQVVAEVARAALSARGVASLRSGEVAVGAMLASLAMRGEDVLLDEVLPLAATEVRLNRYAVGQLTPVAVHRVPTAAALLRALSHCAAGAPGETWEAVAHDGRAPVAVASARTHELRWLQPPAPDAPHSASWVAPTTDELPPGATTAWWQRALAPSRIPAPGIVNPGQVSSPIPPAPVPGAASLRAAGPAPQPARHAAPPATPAGGVGAEAVPEQLLAAVGQTVDRALSNALLQLELDPATLDELRDNSVLDRLVTTVSRLEQQVGHVDYVTRELQALTTAVDELTDSVRSLVRQQWDSMPPPNIWTRLQRADDEVRRAVDELAAEVRGRLPRPGARGA